MVSDLGIDHFSWLHGSLPGSLVPPVGFFTRKSLFGGELSYLSCLYLERDSTKYGFPLVSFHQHVKSVFKIFQGNLSIKYTRAQRWSIPPHLSGSDRWCPHGSSGPRRVMPGKLEEFGSFFGIWTGRLSIPWLSLGHVFSLRKENIDIKTQPTTISVCVYIYIYDGICILYLHHLISSVKAG